MFFKHIYEDGLAQASYLIGCQSQGVAAVIDPRRDIEVYLQEAQRQNLRIVAVTETHIHADYLSGARELAAATGATLYLSDEGDQNWKYSGLEGFSVVKLYHGSTFELGRILFTAVHTPGHTPEHLSFLVTDRAAASEPGFFLTGDFVFVGDIGRPDLLEEAAGIAGTAAPGARRLFHSLKNHFLNLPDYVQVWPGHGAGSACGKALGAVASTTVGYERLFSWWSAYVQKGDEEGFVQALLQGQPEAPSYFAQMKRLNRDGMPLLGQTPTPAKLNAAAVLSWLERGAILVDTRDKLAFAGGHLRGAINVPAGKNFSTWAGWMLPYERPLVLLARDSQIAGLQQQLQRIGLDQVVGYFATLEELPGIELETMQQLSAAEAKALWESGKAVVVDVRSADEFLSGHIPGAINLHAGRVLKNLHRLPQNKPIILHCLGGDRSSTAISALLPNSPVALYNLTGGIRAWQEHGYPIEKGQPQPVEA